MGQKHRALSTGLHLVHGSCDREGADFGQTGLDAERELALVPDQNVARESSCLRPPLAATVQIKDGVQVAGDPVALAAIDLEFLERGPRWDALAEHAAWNGALERGEQQAYTHKSWRTKRNTC